MRRRMMADNRGCIDRNDSNELMTDFGRLQGMGGFILLLQRRLQCSVELLWSLECMLAVTLLIHRRQIACRIQPNT